MPPSFEFDDQILTAQFDAPDDFLERFATAARKQTGFLRWRSGSGSAGQVVLSSVSGGTTFVVEHGLARGHTRYFDEFRAVEAWTKRDEYTFSRLESLMELLDASGASPLLLSLMSVVRAPVTESKDAVRRHIAQTLFDTPRLSSADLVDYTLRAGWSLDQDSFLAVSVSWYQTRAFTVLGAVKTGPLQVRDWEGKVDSEGVEIRLEVNNKKALYRGKVDWTSKSLLAKIRAASERLPEELDRWIKQLTPSGSLDGGVK